MYKDNRMARGRGFGGFRGRGRGFHRGGHPPRGNQRGGNSFQHRGDRNNQKRKYTPRDTPDKRLSEEEIGVTEYICKELSFDGIIKHRFSDFQVSEIDEQGVVAKLTDLTVPEPPKQDDEQEEGDEGLFNKFNTEILPIDTWDKITALVVNDSKNDVEVDVTGLPKENRTKIHEAVKKAFGDSIVGSTVTRDDKKYVTFKKYRTGIRIDKRVKWEWPGEFVHFIVYKENCDTMEAVSQLAFRLDAFHIKPSLIGYAGTKDRRAKTTQWFSLKKIDPNKIARACRDLRDIKAGNYKFCDKQLKLGDLKGNRFRIALRNVTSDDDVINKVCENVKEKGFINYYGLQRFGTRLSIPTFKIGLHLYQKNFKEAIKAILEVREGTMYDALVTYKESNDAEYAYTFVRKYDWNTTEAKLLKHLSVSPNDYCGAISKLPRNIRLLYLHSYQSLIWNRCVSERLRRFSYKPVLGDLVVPLTDSLASNNLEIGDEEIESEEDEATDIILTNEPTADFDKTTDNSNRAKLAFSKEKRVTVKSLTQNDIDSGVYSMFDVVLPLPGFDIQYPSNMKDFYDELMKNDNVDLNVRSKYKSFNVSGAYRYMLARPLDMEWSCVKYDDPFGDLILSDYDQIMNKTNNTILENGKYKALLLTMSLSTSCYATMALRELLKSDTSGNRQAAQNDYFKDNNDTTEKIKNDENTEIDSKKAKLDNDEVSIKESVNLEKDISISEKNDVEIKDLIEDENCDVKK